MKLSQLLKITPADSPEMREMKKKVAQHELETLQAIARINQKDPAAARLLAQAMLSEL